MFKFHRVKALLVATSLAICAPLHATIITFDDVSTVTGAIIPNGYNGLDWVNFSVSNSNSIGSGYVNGRISNPFVAYNRNATPAAILSSSTFGVVGGYFTSAWRIGLDVNVEGWLDGLMTHTASFQVDSTAPSYVALNFNGIDELRLSTSGGVETPGLSGSGAHLAIDNLEINGINGVPEPSSFMIWGLTSIGFTASKVVRRKRLSI